MKMEERGATGDQEQQAQAVNTTSMTEISATDTASLGRTKRWLTPLLITAYVVVVLLISGLSKAREQQTVAGPIGESTSAASTLDDADQIHR